LASQGYLVSEYCPMAALKHLTGALAGTLINLENDVTVIGRLPECDIVLEHLGVSRRHAEIHKDGTSYSLVDLGSRNKTILNGTELQGNVKQLLKPNDRISIGGVEFVYAPAAPPKKVEAVPAPALVEAPPTMFAESARVMEVTASDGAEESELVTLDVASSSTSASKVRPEVKLKSIIEITRSLSNELRIDNVGPRILDSLMQIFPGAERFVLMLQDPSSKRLVMKAFKARPKKRSFLQTTPDDEV